MIKIFDVSNSVERPPHRSLGGPVQNDIMTYLKKYANSFGFSFVNNECDCDIIFTNDVFPHFLTTKKPKVKRMDGIYSRLDLLSRNISLNNAAIEADYIIFISEFSKKSILSLYPEININNKHEVILNSIDPTDFYPIKKNKNDIFTFISTANNWARPEKRGQELIELFSYFPNLNLNLIGTPTSPKKLKNINYLGYISDYHTLNKELNKSDAFIYLGYNDPAPKTVLQALNCKLPLFLTNSGGNIEVSHNLSFYHNEKNEIDFHENIDELNLDLLFKDLNIFLTNIDKYKKLSNTFNSKESFYLLLSSYFNAFKNILS